MHRSFRGTTLTALLVVGTLGWAASLDDYRLGVGAFKQGQYGVALEYFTHAYDAGRRDPTLFYNLGSVHFKLGDYAAAFNNFEHIAADPIWGALAQYNLGLIEERLGNPSKAQQHYRAAYASAQSDKVRQLAARKLDLSKPEEHDDDKWFGIASVAVGYDDNVVLLNDQSLTQVSDKQDYFAEALVSASGFVQGDVDGGWRADLSGYYRAYRDLDDYDYGNAAAGLTYNRIGYGAQWQLGGRVDAQFVGGDAYAFISSVRAQMLHPVGPFNLRIRNDVSYVDGAADFDYVTGWQDRFAVQLNRTFAKTRLRFGYELELNDRRDYATTTEFFSYSPLWNRIYVDATRFVSDTMDVQLRAEYQTGKYADENVQTNPDNTVTIAKRDDDRFITSLRTTYRLSDAWDVFGEYAYTNNSSKFSEYEYHDNQISIGIERPF